MRLPLLPYRLIGSNKPVKDAQVFRVLTGAGKLDRTRGAVRPLGGYLGRELKNHKNHQKVRKKRVPENGSRPA